MSKKNWLRILMLVLMAMMFVNVALAETYKLNYTFTNHPHGIEGYTAEFEAGSVQLSPVTSGSPVQMTVSCRSTWSVQVSTPPGAAHCRMRSSTRVRR